jgi:LPS-assembly protein
MKPSDRGVSAPHPATDYEERINKGDRSPFGRGAVPFLIALLLFLPTVSVWAQAAQTGSRPASEEINVSADRLSVGDGGTQIEAQGNVEVTRQQTTLKADEVRVNRVTQDVEAQGKASVDDPEWKIKSADSIQMNLENETGEIRNGDLFIEQGHVSITGRRFQKFVGQSYHIDEGFFTTCLCDSGRPPWRISAEAMDLTPDGLGTVKDAYFYVLDVPVFYLPYGFFPVRTERQTGFLFPRVGYSSREGARFLQPFFWAISKSTDATLAFDIESRARVGLLGEFRTLFSREADFQIHSSYFNEGLRTREQKDVEDRTIADPHIPTNRWSINGTHRYPLPANWLTYSDFAAYGDDLFTRELIDRFDLPGGREDDVQRSRYGRSRFGLFRSWGDAHFRSEWNFYQDFVQSDATTLHRTPELAFWGRRFGGRFPLEFRWNVGGINYLRRKGGDGLRLDLRPEIVLPLRMASYLFGSLSVAPRETLYHLYSLANSDRNISRELVEVRGNIGTSLSRVFGWGAAAGRIKHVIEPELSYLFVPRTDQSDIPIMDGIDRINRRNVVTFGLSNRFWGKFPAALPGAAADQDVEVLNPAIASDVQQLGSLRLALSYDIDKERKGGDSLSDVDMTLRLTPTDYLTFGFNGGVNPGQWQVTQARATFAISDPRPLVRRVLDPDFNRPNAFVINYHFLRRGPNSLLAENANIDLDRPPNCPADRLDPRCVGFDRDTVGNLSGNVFYHATDNILLFLSSTYNVRDSRFNGIRAVTKILSACECWALTFGVKKEINPARTSVNFDFSLLGLGTPRSTLR